MKTTTRLKRKTITLLLAGATGAALTYYFDPERGEQRREQLARRISDTTSDVVSARRQIADTVDDVAATTSGADGEPVDSSVTEALESDEPLPDIGGVTNPTPPPGSVR